jgi:ribosomal protein L25 (general stress protein Ctc)
MKEKGLRRRLKRKDEEDKVCYGSDCYVDS